MKRERIQSSSRRLLLGTMFIGLGLLAACGQVNPSSDAAVPGGSTLESQVVGGYNASPNQFPFIASLGHCTGSIINKYWVLTAKHCVAGRTPASLRVVAGEHRRSVSEGTEQVRNGLRLVQHPTRDLALIRLNSALTFNTSVTSIAVSPLPAVGSTFLAAGWGATNPDGTGSTDIPKYHYPKLAADSVCGSIPGDEFCGQDPTNQGQQVCFGDSGGPAFQYRWIGLPPLAAANAEEQTSVIGPIDPPIVLPRRPYLIGAVERATRTGSGGPCTRGMAIFAALDVQWIKNNTPVPIFPFPIDVVTPAQEIAPIAQQ